MSRNDLETLYEIQVSLKAEEMRHRQQMKMLDEKYAEIMETSDTIWDADEKFELVAKMAKTEIDVEKFRAEVSARGLSFHDHVTMDNSEIVKILGRDVLLRNIRKNYGVAYKNGMRVNVKTAETVLGKEGVILVAKPQAIIGYRVELRAKD